MSEERFRYDAAHEPPSSPLDGAHGPMTTDQRPLVSPHSILTDLSFSKSVIEEWMDAMAQEARVQDSAGYALVALYLWEATKCLGYVAYLVETRTEGQVAE